MNIVFFVALGIYLLIFLGISVWDVKGVKNFTDFAVAGRTQGTFAVTMTLLATMLGASTTIGITDTVYTDGLSGIWWMVCGAIGMILQSLLISGKVRETEADTLPDLARITVGKAAEMIIALVIVISWIGVIAGQLVALNSLVLFATGKSDIWIFILISAIVIIYTMLGGQSSVVRTDKLQAFVIVIGIILCIVYIYVVMGNDPSRVSDDIGTFSEGYSPLKYFNQLFVIGGVFFLGPDIISRNFISKDESIAKKSAMLAGIGLFIFSIFIGLIGMWAKNNIPVVDMKGSRVLFYVANMTPVFIRLPLIFGLLSAILSSTDTCIINASSIFVKDILKKDSVKAIRITVAVLGALATILAVSGRGDIMSLLSGAYSVYTPGVIFPLLIAILFYKKHGIKTALWVAAVIVGGLFGIAGTYFGELISRMALPGVFVENMTLVGMALSLVIALLSVRWKESDQSLSSSE